MKAYWSLHYSTSLPLFCELQLCFHICIYVRDTVCRILLFKTLAKKKCNLFPNMLGCLGLTVENDSQLCWRGMCWAWGLELCLLLVDFPGCRGWKAAPCFPVYSDYSLYSVKWTPQQRHLWGILEVKLEPGVFSLPLSDSKGSQIDIEFLNERIAGWCLVLWALEGSCRHGGGSSSQMSGWVCSYRDNSGWGP